MPRRKKVQEEPLTDLEMLDELITTCYGELCKKLKQPDNVKLGDFLKMLETRRKMAPDDSDQSAFWEMLDAIRKEALVDSNEDTT